MKGLLLGVAAMLALPSAAQAATFINGDFETGNDPGTYFLRLGTDSTALTGWTITSGNVELIGGYWQSGSGSRSIDLNGSAQGAIAQTFDTIEGMTYNVDFLMAGNPEGGPAVKTLEVAATGNDGQLFSFDNTGFSKTNMGWTNYTYTFTASGNLTTLSFASMTDSPWTGPALDGVTVTAMSAVPVPEPTTWALMLGGFALIGSTLRRRQSVVQFS
ncbi:MULTISPECIES: choice-of-anchor C family PEP-CTERM protein [unclassified Sphingobium]|uniref:choice-of-anchor C family PEP-CTERM protein n=1 Tax=unclassified Sphingobium TaxID=2611147 RepID=UPI002225A267|nr:MULTISPECIES: choice-of-anchor C family protein [unclassified Sphingobium]MCW2395846.1 choice-of-anchor C domain-containing protein [Sphingobium sp. B8D3B]MCW2419361.1 choice-of-anchor C domain-containing protein [Sphingobium sp. B8D3C]